MLFYKVSEVSKLRGLIIQTYLLKDPNQSQRSPKTYLGSMCVPEESWFTVRGYLSGFVDETVYLSYKQAKKQEQEEIARTEEQAKKQAQEKRNELLERLLSKYTPEQLAKLLEAK